MVEKTDLSRHLLNAAEQDRPLDPETKKLIQQEICLALQEGNNDPISQILNVAREIKDDLPYTHIQIRHQVTLGHLKYLLNTGADKETIRQFIFNGPYQTKDYHTPTHLPSETLETLGSTHPNITLEIVHQNSFLKRHPQQYQELVSQAIISLPLVHQRPLTQELANYLLSTSPDDVDKNSLDTAKSSFATTLIKRPYLQDYQIQISLELANSIDNPNKKRDTLSNIIGALASSPDKARRQLAQELQQTTSPTA